MREILFKAKLVDNGEWVEGVPVRRLDGKTAIITGTYKTDDNPIFFSFKFVIPETVCQYTGLRDKNGKRIFEGDILSYNDEPPIRANRVVTFGKLRIMYRLKFTDRIGTELYEFSLPEFDHLEITGNIHDTTEATK